MVHDGLYHLLPACRQKLYMNQNPHPSLVKLGVPSSSSISDAYLAPSHLPYLHITLPMCVAVRLNLVAGLSMKNYFMQLRLCHLELWLVQKIIIICDDRVKIGKSWNVSYDEGRHT